ncbi:ankyrin repeat domain-containing protein [Deinococcus budaensis]|uniref:Ankyrin repeat protein n=1 Tax=Deinococcus budaensis TaxID=1665626 RepID=A0A7W8GJ25_9DEIO|nr:ankyrin repeat domain-containing protein [Deinococcus budaensis]MBB5236153.1 ankyrin repeat protein [Deinococcus budaensis]
MTDAVQDLFQSIHANNLEGVRLLIGAEPGLLTATSPTGLSPVLFATYYRRPQITRLLIEAGASLSAFEAAATGELAVLRGQLDAQPDLLHAFSPDGFSLLGLAALFGHEGVAAELLSRGANVNRASQNALEVQPLHSAVAGDHPALARRLLDAGADVNAVQHGGLTPLMGAARNGNQALVVVLLAAGADPAARTADGQDAEALAAEEGHQAVAGILRAARHEPQGTRNAAAGAEADTGRMTDNRDGRPDEERERHTPMPVNELTGQADPRTGFQTHDPKDAHQARYTSTPAEDRVASADQGKGISLPATDPGDVTHQFDHLATRDPEAMEKALEAPEFAGAQTVAGTGVDSALADGVVPMGLGVSAGMGVVRERQHSAADLNPGYTPPSQQTSPHPGEQPGDLPPGTPTELRAEVRGDADDR